MVSKFIVPVALVLALVIVTLPGELKAAKMLSISFLSSPSHKIIYEPLLYKLAERGHQMTILSPVKSSKSETKNVRLFESIPLSEFEKDLAMPNFFETKASRSGWMGAVIQFVLNPWVFMGGMMTTICQKQYQLPIVKQILEEHAREPFDLILFTPMFNECLYGLVHKMNVTTILINQVPVLPWIGSNLGSPNLPSFIPTMMLSFGDKMTLTQRVINFFATMYTDLSKRLLYDRTMAGVYREFFNDPTIPGVREIERNSSIVLCNSHVAFSPSKPLLPDVVNVGGMHLKKPKPCPKDLDDFLSSSGDDGFIYFSMGSALKGSTMPEQHRKIFLNTFAQLKQKVLWKWETEQMDDLPPNVKLSKWLPQQDVLGHKNIRLFITHGGHGSTTEALYHGVPLVGIPIYGDQISNMDHAEQLGFALPVDFAELEEKTLLATINTVLKDPSYRQKVKKLSAIYHDDIDHPLDRAAFHVEYVLRHQGARHLRSPARDLNVIEYYSVDAMVILGAIFGAIGYLNFIVARAVLRKLFGSKKQGKVSSVKKDK